MQHTHSREEEQRLREAALDDTIAQTFPASDPPSTLPNPAAERPLDDEMGAATAGDAHAPGQPGDPSERRR